MVKNTGSILIVDDNRLDVLLVMKSLLKLELNREIDHAADGKEAVDYLESGKLPSIIFLDLNMPVMDGLDFLRRRLTNAEWHKIPVVVLSSSHEEVDKKGAFELGASDYMVKPNDFTEMTATLKEMVDRWVVGEVVGQSH